MTNSSLQSRTRPGLNPLSIVLPHPPLPRRRSSLLSVSSLSAGAGASPQSQSLQLQSSGPRTPRSCASPCLPTSVYYPANRKSTDSWNSSNADEMEFDWWPEQVLLLQRTLDALPAHLVTPFNGPIPPSNLLDKIARGVSQAKGPVEWPHSIRATRAKLLELARAKAKEEKIRDQTNVIKEEVEVEMASEDPVGTSRGNYTYFQDGEEKPVAGALGLASPHMKRPLYRQSSMDFIRPSEEELKGNASISRLSKRLQRGDRLFPNPGYHPYSRNAPRTSGSPPKATNNSSVTSDVPSLIAPSTPSSSTLNTVSSFSAFPGQGPQRLRRSASTLSTSTASSMNMSIYTSSSGSAPDPRVQRILRSASLYGSSASHSQAPPIAPVKDAPQLRPPVGFKRAPSYGTQAHTVRTELATHGRKQSGSYPSSDEEEKNRDSIRKKPKKTSGNARKPVILPTSSMLAVPKDEDVAMASTSTSGGSGSSGLFDSTGTVGSSCATSVSSSSAKPAMPILASKDKERPKTRSTTATVTNTLATPTKSRVKSPSPSSARPVAMSPTPKLPPMPTSPRKEKVVKVRSITNTAGLGIIPATSPPPPMPKVTSSRKEGKRDRENVGENPTKRTLTSSASAAQDKPSSVARSQPQYKSRRPAPINLQRNPSMFGAELPSLSSATTSSSSAATPTASPREQRTRKSTSSVPKSPGPVEVYTRIVAAHMGMPVSPAPLSPSPSPASTAASPSVVPTAPSSPMSPASPTSSSKPRTLRRVRRLAPARRISFGSLAASGSVDEARSANQSREESSCLQLGSAFQLG